MTNIPGENVEDRGIGNQSKENNETQRIPLNFIDFLKITRISIRISLRK